MGVFKALVSKRPGASVRSGQSAAPESAPICCHESLRGGNTPGNILGYSHCHLDLHTNRDHGTDLQSPSLIISTGLNTVSTRAGCHGPGWFVDMVGGWQRPAWFPGQALRMRLPCWSVSRDSQMSHSRAQPACLQGSGRDRPPGLGGQGAGMRSGLQRSCFFLCYRLFWHHV